MLKHAFFMALTLIAALVAVVYAFKLLFGILKVIVIGVVFAVAAFLLYYFASKLTHTPRHGAGM